MKGKGLIAAIIAVILFFTIVYGGEYLLLKTLPHPKTSGFYEDGEYAEYRIKWDEYGVMRLGKLWFRVVENTLIVNLTLFYEGSYTVLTNEVRFNISGDDVYYYGEKVVLPFFYGNGNVVSYYNGSYTNASHTEDYTMYPFNTHGIVQYRWQLEVDTYNYIKGESGAVLEQGDHSDYHYGMVSRLLFFAGCFGFDPIINGLLAHNKNFIFLLGLEKTNIHLGPVDYFSMIQIYIWMLWPILLALAIPAFVILIYRYIKERKEGGYSD